MKLINSCKFSVQRFLTYLPSVSITTWPYLLFYMFAFRCFACVLLRTELLSFVKSKLVKQQLYSGDTSSTACKVSIPYSVVMSCCHIDLQICFRNICKQNQLDSHSLSLSLSLTLTHSMWNEIDGQCHSMVSKCFKFDNHQILPLNYLPLLVISQDRTDVYKSCSIVSELIFLCFSCSNFKRDRDAEAMSR